jgi:hypothetical protein
MGVYRSSAAALRLFAYTILREWLMETAAELAKKYNLEQYLNKPGELNNAIFNLMLLQETVQLEQSRKLKFIKSNIEMISVSRTAHGKFIAACSGDRKYRYAVETALKTSTTVIAVFQRGRFINVLRSMGLPEDKITEYCDTVTIDDSTQCIDRE